MDFRFCEFEIHKRIAVLVYCGDTDTGKSGELLVNKLKKKFPVLQQNGLIKKFTEVSQLKEVLLTFRKKRIKILAVAGGDRTFHLILNSSILVWSEKRLPAFLLLPTSKVNLLNRDIAYGKNPIRVLKKVLKRIKKKRRAVYTSRRLLKVNDKYGFIFAAGFPVHFYRDLEAASFSSSKIIALLFKYFFILFPLNKSVFETIKFSCSLQKSKKEDEKNIVIKKTLKANLILAQSIRPLLGVFKPCFNAVDLKDEFVLIRSSMSRFNYFLHGFHFLLNWKIKSSKFFRRKIFESEITFEKTQTYFLDGELYRAGKVSLEAGESVKFIHP